jgi:curved DNA-binding protein CbpA
MENSIEDPYEVLDIPHNATKKQIKKAFRRLAKRFHPDRNRGNPEAEEKFKKVQAAYDILIKGQGKKILSRAHFTEKHSPYAKSEHPFYSFFSAVNAYYSQRGDKPHDKKPE